MNFEQDKKSIKNSKNVSNENQIAVNEKKKSL